MEIPWEVKGVAEVVSDHFPFGRGRSECDLQLYALKLDWNMEIMFLVSGKRKGAVKTTLNDLANIFFPPECSILPGNI